MNELPLIQLPNPKLKGYITVCLYVAHSTFEEPKDKPGVNHLLEHVLSTADNIDKDIARMGLEQNAETHGGFVRYWFSTPPKHLDFCLKYLMKLAKNPTFKNVKREAHAVRQELLSLLSSTEYHTELATMKVLFPGSSYLRGNDVKPMLKALPKFNSKNLKKYYEKYYKNNMFIVISGSNRLPNFVKTRKTGTRFKIPEMLTAPLPDNKRVIHVKRPEVEKSQCKLIFYNKPLDQELKNKTKNTIHICTRILASGLDSLLYRILRGKLRLVYSVSCDALIEPYGILIEIEWSCDTRKVERCVKAVRSVVENFRPLHFNGHKELYLEHLVRYSVLTSKDIVEMYGEELVTWGKYTPVESIIRGIRKIRASEIEKIVKKYMNFRTCFLVHASSDKKAPIKMLK